MKWTLGVIFLAVCHLAEAQKILTVEEAIERLMQNNFEIRISQNNTTLAKTNAVRENVGYYPTVQLTGAMDADFGGALQTFQDGNKIDASANLTQTYNAALTVRYPIYQGGLRKNTLQQLHQRVDQMTTQERQTAEAQIVQLLTLYYRAVEAKQNYLLQQELVSFSNQRLEQARTNYELGRANRLDIATAEVDLQRDSSNLITGKASWDQARRDMLFAMGDISADAEFEVENDIQFDLAHSLEALQQMAKKDNVQLDLITQDQILLESDRQILKSQFLPQVDFVSDYSFRYQDFGSGGFFATQRANGIGGTLSVSYNLYDGGNRQLQKKILKVNEQDIELRRERQEATMANDLANLFHNYQAALKLNAVEKSAIQSAESAFQRSRDEYELGRLGQIEYRQAQINLFNARLSECSSAVSAKILETQIKQIVGLLWQG